jgi:choline dehydrogenase-like flavoprotein
MAHSAATGVVDYDGSVFGVQGLHVSDSTIIPTVPDGNMAAAAMMVGFRIAEFIKAAH